MRTANLTCIVTKTPIIEGDKCVIFLFKPTAASTFMDRYLDWLYKKHDYYNKLPIYNNLRDTLEAAVGQHLFKL